jgi:DNA-binding FadR family transcriptional regulator
MSGAAMSDNIGTRVDQAVRRVRDHIRANDMKVGDTLPGEGHFASELGVSRAVMREAFGALAALRLIDVGNGRRARVGAIDGSVMGTSLDHAVATAQVSVAQVWEVRRTLELRTVELAALNRSEDQARVIVAEAANMRRAADDLSGVVHHDIAFHQTIARASGNALFLQIIRSFEPLMRIAVPTAWQTRVTPKQRDTMFDCHAAIADAVARRDTADAIAGMNRHFDASIGDLFTGATSSRV